MKHKKRLKGGCGKFKLHTVWFRITEPDRMWVISLIDERGIRSYDNTNSVLMQRTEMEADQNIRTLTFTNVQECLNQYGLRVCRLNGNFVVCPLGEEPTDEKYEPIAINRLNGVFGLARKFYPSFFAGAAPGSNTTQ